MEIEQEITVQHLTRESGRAGEIVQRAVNLSHLTHQQAREVYGLLVTALEVHLPED